MFNREDVSGIESRGSDLKSVETQLENFTNGFPPLGIDSAASVGNGIVRLDGAALMKYTDLYEEYAKGHKIQKFVPASGAATRMFKDLFEFLSTGKRNGVVADLLANLDGFAFAEELRRHLPDEAADKDKVVALVSGDGLDYGNRPKALIMFHRYADEVRTALEEHLVEGAMYAACGGEVNIHFTVSPEHRAGFDALLGSALPRYGERYGVKYNVEMSEQRGSTDTIAVNPDLTPFRDADGSLLFRPAGHGALIENLNDIDADIVFIKNIDNVTTDSRRADTVTYKKALAGVLAGLQGRIRDYMSVRDMGQIPEPGFLNEVGRFISGELCVRMPAAYSGLPAAQRWERYRDILDRPVRVCGMVKNEGEPGGGPMWVDNADGTTSLQIVESSQFTSGNQHILEQGTHFNPVDIVCGVKNYRGEKFDLTKYVDSAAGFISLKSRGGKPLLAQELPGLWNGAMSKWNTVFVEVPVSTFTPVKIVTDLLRPQHREGI